MLTTMKNNRSLTFYQPTIVVDKRGISSAYAGGLGSVAWADVSATTAAKTTTFNTQLNGFLNSLNAERDRLTLKVAQGLSQDASYTGARSDGVRLAWKYEQADIEMGGKGSGDWNQGHQVEIAETGRVRGAEGHHLKNVVDHPGDQANPDNIKFYITRAKHLQEGHDGNFQNGSDAPMIDKDKILKDTNTKRVFKNELEGLGIAVAIGLGIGFTIGFAVTLAQSGVTLDALKVAAIEGIKGSAEAGTMSAIGYGIGRTLGQVATKALTGLIENLGINLAENISKMCNMGAVGALTIVVFSAYQFIKLKIRGVSTVDALRQIGKQALFSLSLLAVSIAAQGIWGGPAGIIVSVSIGIIFIACSVASDVHQRRFSEEVRIYMIDKCKPVFAER